MKQLTLFVVLLGVIFFLNATVIKDAEAVWSGTFFWKDPYHDYAQAGMPDFDQKQDLWGKNDPQGMWRWTWCGPVAVADSLWWLDSKYESVVNPNPTKPPPISDSFSLVWAYGLWDDHDGQNVDPLVRDLAGYMFTDGGCQYLGTTVWSMQAGIDQYLWEHELHKDNHSDHRYWFEEVTVEDPTIDDIRYEILQCHDVILLLGFYVWEDDPGHPNGGYYVRHGGHYVTAAGVDPWKQLIGVSDPFIDTVAGDNGPSGPGHMGWSHTAVPHGPTEHNDADFVSHDIYGMGVLSDGETWLVDYPWSLGPTHPNWFDIYDNFRDVNPVTVPVVEVQNVGPYMTKVEYKVAVFDNAYLWKPPYHDYAQAGLPDFDQKQDEWGKVDPASGSWRWTWCGPVAVADSLWWLDSKFETLINPAPVKPPAISDSFWLLSAYGPWDDHNAQNVDPFVRDLAAFMKTDGDPYCAWLGTRVDDMQQGIDDYLWDRGLHKDNHPETEYYLQEVTVKDPSYAEIHKEILKCQDVILLLGFYEWIEDPSQTEVKWSQKPDMVNGYDVLSNDHLNLTVADDWECIDSRPVIDVHWWGSYEDNIYIPPSAFIIRIYDDLVGAEPSQPGNLLYEELIDFAQCTEEYYGLQLRTGADAYYYSAFLRTPFPQEKGQIYWISIQAFCSFTWGWKTSEEQWRDDAVWTDLDPLTGPWYEVIDPDTGDSRDMAFQLTVYGGYYLRHGGHYVAVAGVGCHNACNPWLGISDPWMDTLHGDNGPSGPGHMGWSHTAVPHPTWEHNDADFVSHDIYFVDELSDGEIWLINYPWSLGPDHTYWWEIYENFYGVNPVDEEVLDVDYVDPYITKVEYKVAIIPHLFTFTDIKRDHNNNVTITWESDPTKTYDIEYSDEPFRDCMGWSVAVANYPADPVVDVTSWTETVPPEIKERYYRVKVHCTCDYTTDVVGIYKIILRNSAFSGMNYVSTTLIPYDNTLDGVLDCQLSGSVIPQFADRCWKWNQATLSYEKAYYDGTNWLDFYNPGNPPTFTFDADGGYRVELTPVTPDLTPLYFVGKVSTEARAIPLTKTVFSGQNEVGSTYPMTVSLDNSGMLGSNFSGSVVYAFSDKLWFWDWPTLSYIRIYYNTGTGQWLNYPAETPATKKLEPGEGFTILLTPVSLFNLWVYPKPYIEPPN